MPHLDDIQLRDPFLLVDRAQSRYYLYGSTDEDIWDGPGVGFDCYSSADLIDWHGPLAAFRPPQDFWSTGSFWAPEVHLLGERWYMFATFAGGGRLDEHGRPERGTQVLIAASPTGPFVPWSDGPVTPRDWSCLDGTLFVSDDGQPWIVFCREWTQVGDGEIYAQRLTHDLRSTSGIPVLLFRASDAPWIRPVPGAPAELVPALVTDGPYLVRRRDGRLDMLWSSFGVTGYAMGFARSASGEILGPWSQADQPIWGSDGGHGMIAELLDGRLVLTLHQPNTTPDERAVLRYIVEDGDGFRLCPDGPVANALGRE